MRKPLGLVISAFLVLLCAGAAVAQYNNDFETLIASPSGVVLTGQDLFYLPAGSVDFFAYTYAGNTLGLPANPFGGEKFVGGRGPGGTTYARAQRDVTFGVGAGQWKIQYDFCAAYLASPPSANNIGSFSIRYSDTYVHEIHLFSWVDPNNPVAYNAFYMAYDISGTQFAQPGASPGPAWENLALNHWYRAWTTIDLDMNTVVEVGIIDLSTMATSVFHPVDWFLVGGAAGAPGPPLNFRFFAGGSVDGNVTAWDNMSIAQPTPPGACCLPSGVCQVMTQEECTTQGGMFFAGVTCDPNPCPPIPVERTTWGTIKNAYR